MQLDTLMPPRRRYTDLWVFLGLLFAGALVCFTRNPAAFMHPAFFAEDGTWVDIAINKGSWYAVQFGRWDFPGFLQVGLTVAAYQTSKLFYGYDLSELPRFIAVYSYAFYAFCAYCGYFIGSHYINRKAGTLIWALILLLPLSDPNITLGRNLQWQFVMPFVTIFGLLAPSYYPRLKAAFYGAALITFLSFPPCIVIGLIYIVFNAIGGFSIVRHKEASPQTLVLGATIRSLKTAEWLLLFAIGLCIYYITTREAFSTNSDREGAFVIANAVEFIFYRVIMYPFTVRWTSDLSNGWVIGFTVLFLGSALLMGTRTAKREQQLRFWLFLLASFVSYWVLLCMSRHGLSRIFTYQEKGIQHYFLGLNMFAVAVLVYGLWPWARMLREERIYGAGLLAVLACLLVCQSNVIFQIDHRAEGLPEFTGRDWRAEVTKARNIICAENCDRPEIAAQSYIVPTYPKEGGISLPWRYLNATADPASIKP